MGSRGSSNDMGTSVNECVWLESSHYLDFHGLFSRGKEALSFIETGVLLVIKQMKDPLSASQVDILSPIQQRCCEGYLSSSK